MYIVHIVLYSKQHQVYTFLNSLQSGFYLCNSTKTILIKAPNMLYLNKSNGQFSVLFLIYLT